ncbi:MAG: helix-turn-helix domain-containing protein [Luteolibacter sp.]
MQEHLFHEGLYVTHAGWEHILPDQPYPNINHPPFYYFRWEDGRILPAFCLAWVVSGRGEFQTKGSRRIVETGDVFLMLPGEWHRHRPEPQVGWKLVWVEFNGTRPYQWWKGGVFGVEANFPTIEDAPLFARQFERLLDHVSRHPSGNSTALSAQAAGLLSHLMRETGDPQQGETGDPMVDRAIAHIWNFSHGVLDVTEIANHVGVGRRTLERRFRAIAGRALLDEIQQCRFTRAARLLVETELPVKVIVDRAGFTSYERMRQVFRKFTGVTPESYRRQPVSTAG